MCEEEKNNDVEKEMESNTSPAYVPVSIPVLTPKQEVRRYDRMIFYCRLPEHIVKTLCSFICTEKEKGACRSKADGG